jgi:hypothetical protein
MLGGAHDCTGAGFELFSASLLVACDRGRTSPGAGCYPAHAISTDAYMMATIASASVIKVLCFFSGDLRRRIPPFGTEVIRFTEQPPSQSSVCRPASACDDRAPLSEPDHRGEALRASAINLNGAELVGIVSRKSDLVWACRRSGALTGLSSSLPSRSQGTNWYPDGPEGLVAAISGNWTYGIP